MGLGVRRSETSCFCSEGCPAGTMPFKQYWIAANAPTQPHYGFNSYLYRHTSSEDGVCVWESVTNHFLAPKVEVLSKTELPNDGTFKAYRMTLVLLEGILSNVYRQDYVTPLPEPDGLVQPNASTSCSRIAKFLPHFVLGLPWFALLTPAYPDACDDSDFPAKEQRKEFAAF